MSESKIVDKIWYIKRNNVIEEIGVFKSKNAAIFAKIKDLEKELTDLIEQLDVEPLRIK